MAKEKGLFGRYFNNCLHTLCVFPENCNRYEYFFEFMNIYQLCVIAITLIRAGLAVQGPLVSYKVTLL